MSLVVARILCLKFCCVVCFQKSGLLFELVPASNNELRYGHEIATPEEIIVKLREVAFRSAQGERVNQDVRVIGVKEALYRAAQSIGKRMLLKLQL